MVPKCELVSVSTICKITQTPIHIYIGVYTGLKNRETKLKLDQAS